MCGISAAFHYGEKKKETVNHHIMDTYEEQHHRGTEGFGLVCLGEPKEPITVIRATEPIKALVDLYMNGTTMAIFHHRSPTATINDLSQTHPMMVESDNLKYNYVVVHNGVIRNADEMFKKHELEKFIYTTYYETHYPFRTSLRSEKAVPKFNDSESLAIELAKFLDGKSEKLECQGSAAFIVLQCNKDWTPVALHFGRNTMNPLNMDRDESSLYLSSEGQGDPIEPGIMYTSQIEDPKFEITQRPFAMSEAIVSIYTPTPKSAGTWKGYCEEGPCKEEKVTGSNKCVLHCDPKHLTAGYKQLGTKNDSRALCKVTGCYKKARAQEGLAYCKKHRELAEKDKPATQTPIGFKTPAEQKALEDEATKLLDTAKAEMKMVDPEDQRGLEEAEYEDERYDVSEEASQIDAVVNEYYDMIEAEMLPNAEEYKEVIGNLLERSYAKLEAKAIAMDIRPIELSAPVGDKAKEAESYLAATEYDLTEDVPKRGPSDELEAELNQEIDREIAAQQRLNHYF